MELLVTENAGVRSPRWLLVHAVLVFAFLYLPIAVLIVYSFNGEGVGGFPPRNLTFDWYRTLFADGAIWESVANSLLVALAVALVGATKVVSTSGFAPVVVAKTLPLRRPTKRTLSSVGAIPIADTATPAISGF